MPEKSFTSLASQGAFIAKNPYALLEPSDDPDSLLYAIKEEERPKIKEQKKESREEEEKKIEKSESGSESSARVKSSPEDSDDV